MLINDPFEGKVRVRVCGILMESEQILLLKHDRIGSLGYLWAPPGGGVKFGNSLEETLIREFQEETGLSIEIKDYLFTNEYIGKKYHALEVFYKVERKGGELRLGTDPELATDNQMLSAARFFNRESLNLIPALAIHSAFNCLSERYEITELRGLHTFKDY